MKKVLYGLGIALVLVIYTKVIWQSGFDQGADVSLCVVESMIASEGEVVSLADSETCKRAKAYESNPLWQLRRRGDINGVEVKDNTKTGIVTNVV